MGTDVRDDHQEVHRVVESSSSPLAAACPQRLLLFFFFFLWMFEMSRLLFGFLSSWSLGGPATCLSLSLSSCSFFQPNMFLCLNSIIIPWPVDPCR